MAAKTRQRRVSDLRQRPPRKKPAGGGRSVVKKSAVGKPVSRKPGVKKSGAKKRGARTVCSDIVQLTLATFAHEVRTPLTGILALSDLLAASDLDEQERRWVETIKTGAQHLASLATLFVDAARTTKGSTKGSGERLEVFDLRALAGAVGDSLAGRAVVKGLKARVEIADSLPALVVGDPVRVRAALENLIDNAVKFTAHGGVEFLAEPWVLPPPKSGRSGKRVGVAFVISDSGIGVSLAEIKRLFRPFTQAGVSIAARFGGAGLGLSSVKQLARAMGGDITVTPRPQGGVSFRLTLCLKPPPASDAHLPRGGATPDPGGPMVLSVADNPFGRVVLNTILSELGYQAEFVPRCEDAIARLVQGRVDAVLMDLVAPGIDVTDAVRRIRKAALPGETAVVAISSRGEDEAAAVAAGADAFLLKPVSLQDLAAVLVRASRRGEA
ncbi:MAG: hybrid sensor histidine kinase/response regulator [Alphaproteobacteria bacterium]|nr:hybrid sensor histidine kinase/response regulator [Alphaproteobacteria bacterium]